MRYQPIPTHLINLVEIDSSSFSVIVIQFGDGGWCEMVEMVEMVKLWSWQSNKSKLNEIIVIY